MKSGKQPLVLAAAGAGLLSLGALTWVARDLIGSARQADARPSLLELLEEVGNGSNPQAPQAKPAPPPPAQARWQAPLSRSCSASDGELRQRLADRLANLSSTSTRVRIDPTNYGERFQRDAFGNRIDPTPQVVVLHETVYGMQSAISTFLTPHPRDEDQVSYHTLVGQRGEIVQLLDPSKRAFGAGNSAFNGRWVVTNPKVGGSINNFALHLSLETPTDGENDGPVHSGYSQEQYDAVAVVLADWMRRFNIPPQYITTHRHVDLGGERADPRSFDWAELQRRLESLGLVC
jgi:N-acetyl-anhydromuramyl-L-alanine amidase AmpD